MTFRFSNLDRLQGRVEVDIPGDQDGYLGRECPEPECEGYFKIKPGTGLTGKDLPCFCPYCGNKGSPDQFWTKDQVEYAKSVFLRQAAEAFVKDLKQNLITSPRAPSASG